MPWPGSSPAAEHSVSAQPVPARLVADFFSRALSTFQSSNSKLHVVCTVATAPAPAPHHEGPNPVQHGPPPRPLPPRTRPRTLIVLDSSFNPPTRAHLRMATSAIRDHLAQQETNGGQKKRLGTSLRLLLLLSVNNADKAPKPAAFEQRLALMWAFARDLQLEQQQGGLRGGPAPSPSLSGEEREHDDAEGLSIDLALSTLPYFHEKSAAIAELLFYRGGEEGELGGGGDGGDGEMEQLFLVGYDTLIRIFNPKYYRGAPGSSAAVADVAEAGGGATPMQRVLGPFFARAKLRVTLRTDDDWGGEDEQRAYLRNLLEAEGLAAVGGSREWGGRIETVEGRRVGADIISSTYARAAARDRNWDRLGLMVTPEVGRWIEQEKLYAE